jgi:hypothetical protein
MFAFFKTLAGGANLWFMIALFGIGFSAGTAVTYPLATWKERADWAAPMKQFADQRSADLLASEQARADDAASFTKAVSDVATKNKETQETISTMIENLGGLTNEIHNVRVKLITVPIGNCTFTDDADSLRASAYQAAIAVYLQGRTSETGEAGASDAKPSPASGPGKPRSAPSEGTGSKGN